MRAVKQVVAEREDDAIGAHEVAPDDEGLSEPFRLRLHAEGDPQPELRSVAEQPLKALPLVRRRDDQDLADTRQHESGERVVHHRLVVDGQELLADGPRQGMKSGARSSREDDAFEIHRLNPRRSRS